MKGHEYMRKIVIVTRRMVMGGIEKALISMLENLPKGKFDVTVLVMGHGGELISEIPPHVKVKCLYGNEKTTIAKLINYIKKGKVFSALKVGIYTFLAKRAKTVFDQEMYHSKMLENEDVEYDMAIAYHVPDSFPVVYVINKIKAKRKVAWIHMDVSKSKRSLQRYKEFYDKFDKVFCVSQNALMRFKEVFPDLKDRASVFYNILDNRKIVSLSVNGGSYKDNFNGIRILTIGRLSPEKGQDVIPNVLKKLVSEGFNVRWYCIGDGSTRRNLEDIISQYNLHKHMILLGTKENPYPFIKDCNLYVQPSRHEGYCISLAEARLLHKPIVVTDFVGAREQIENNKNGIIVNFDETEIYSAIRNLIMDKDLSNKFIANLKKNNITTANEIKKIEEMFC